MAESAIVASNATEISVTDLSNALRRTLEDRFAYVRVRGEISGYRGPHTSGHVYFCLKDAGARLDAVIWRSTFLRMRVKPEEGLEVVATGRITTFANKSSYQIVVESIEPAGVGALMALLEARRRKLATEGLFDPARKRLLPYMPRVIGVVTAPGGAVIRDILHRLADRFPVHVLVWPVRVQGETSAAEVAAAINGFNALAPDGAIPRPDVLIVARGGGSLEDLWSFNEEALARAAAASPIPLISTVGHETDTTLIDFVSDRRAPTPTAAAEMATPVLAELRAGLADHERRLIRIAARFLDERRHRLAAAARGLPRPADVLALASQRFDLSAGRLSAALARNAAVHERELVRVATRLSPSLLTRRRQAMADQLAGVSTRLRPAAERRIARARDVLTSLDKLRLSLNPDGPLARGFARVHHADGTLARTAADLRAGEGVKLVFRDGDRGAIIDGEARTPVRAVKKPTTAPADQGDLF